MPRRPDRQAFVSVDWLAKHLHDDDLRILDARYVYPHESPQGEEMYEAGYIPGATYVHWQRDLSVNTQPVPNLVLGPEAFAAKMSQLGIDADTTVVAYDLGIRFTCAARIWWALRYYGHDKVYVMDGGAAAWEAAGKPMTTDVPEPPSHKVFVPKVRPEMRASKAQVHAAITDADTIILEARREPRIRETGATVKGAYWLSRETVFAPTGNYQSLISEDELDSYLRDIGVEEAGQLVTT
jgi:thiosulfate/3-mercaptopyruvate sulfurtransferase